jgi:hypothetical protein
MKRIILATGSHWFYDRASLKGWNGEPLNLVGMLDAEKNLIPFKNLPQSQYARLVLELNPPKRSATKKEKACPKKRSSCR